MKGAFVKCEMCKLKIKDERCIFATYKRVIRGEEHIFCCKSCADKYEKKKK
jgi:YHS domain-containing protein